MKYVYAIRHPAPLPAMAGLDGAELQAVAADGIEAVCCASGRPPQAEPADLWHHEEVVEALMRFGSVLPVRFATRLEDEAAILALLERHRSRLEQGLVSVSGRVEVGVRVLWDEQPPPVPASADTGSEYLRARSAAGRSEHAWRSRAEQRAEQVHAPLAARAAEATHRLLPTPGTLMAGAYLLPASDVEAFEQAVAGLARVHHDLALVPTGPWPPYSFAPDLDPAEPDRDR